MFKGHIFLLSPPGGKTQKPTPLDPADRISPRVQESDTEWPMPLIEKAQKPKENALWHAGHVALRRENTSVKLLFGPYRTPKCKVGIGVFFDAEGFPPLQNRMARHATPMRDGGFAFSTNRPDEIPA
jgi:hypothetical protein